MPKHNREAASRIDEVRVKLRLKVIALFAFVILGLVPLNAPALAGMAVAPCKIELAMDPGSKKEAEIYILNDSRDRMQIALSTWDFARDRQGRPFPISDEEVKTFRGCGNWVTFPSRKLTLGPGQTGKTKINIEAPAKLDLGSYYTYIQVLGTPCASEGEVLVKSKINALLLITIGHTSETTLLERAVQVQGIEVSPVNFSGPVLLAPTVKNKGNYHLNLQGDIQIKQGKKVIKEIPVQECTLLPKDNLHINKIWEDPPLFGEFTAQFTGKTPGLNKVLKAKNTFWVVSKKLIAAILLAIVTLVTVFFVRRRYRPRKPKEA